MVEVVELFHYEVIGYRTGMNERDEDGLQPRQGSRDVDADVGSADGLVLADVSVVVYG